MSLSIPPFGSDPGRVGAYVAFELSIAYSRIFLPLRSRSLRSQWHEMAERSDHLLNESTVLSDIVDLRSTCWNHPYGRRDSAVDQDLVRAIGSAHDLSMGVITLLWRGYAESIDTEDELHLPVPFVGPWRTAEFAMRTQSLGEVLTNPKSSCHYPTYLWSEDLSLILCCPFYSDSLYIGSKRISSSELRDFGLEATAVTQDAQLPTTGD